MEVGSKISKLPNILLLTRQDCNYQWSLFIPIVSRGILMVLLYTNTKSLGLLVSLIEYYVKRFWIKQLMVIEFIKCYKFSK